MEYGEWIEAEGEAQRREERMERKIDLATIGEQYTVPQGKIEHKLDYHDVKAVSQSFLKLYDVDPQHAVDQYFGDKKRDPPTAQMVFGLCVEAALGGKPYDFVVYRGGTRIGKKWEEFRAANKGKAILIPSQVPDSVSLLKCRDNAATHQQAELLFGGGEWSVPLFWKGVEGLTRKAELDRVATVGDRKWIIDVKTADDITPAGFARAAARWGYNRQAAWYQDAWHACHGEWLPMVFFVFRNKGSHGVAVYTLDGEDVERGRAQNERSLQNYIAAQVRGYNGEPQEIRELSLPRWARYEEY